MPANMVRSAVSAAPHTTTIDSAVIGLIAYMVGMEIEGVYETQLEKIETLREGRPDDGPPAEAPPRPETQFRAGSEVVIYLKLMPYYDVVIAPVVHQLRAALIERIQTLTPLHVHAIHIHVSGLRPR